MGGLRVSACCLECLILFIYVGLLTESEAAHKVLQQQEGVNEVLLLFHAVGRAAH